MLKKEQKYKLEKKTGSIENQLIGELYLANNINDITAFIQTYATNYLPVLYYSVKHLDANKIARLMNSSILIDRLISIRINRIVRCQVLSDARELLEINKNIEKSRLIALIDNQTILCKANLSSMLVFMLSFFRSALFSLYCDKKLFLNYGIGWNNLLLHFIENPHLIYLLDKKSIKLAEKQLKFIENDIEKVGGSLEEEIFEELSKKEICSKNEMPNIHIYYAGLKIDWLKSKCLLSFCKFLKTDNKKLLKEAIDYSDIILKTLKSNDINYKKYSFRQKLSTPGPSPNFRKIIGDLSKYKRIIKLFNYVAYFETESEKFVIVFPTNLNFYLNNNVKLEKNNLPLLEDEEFILDVHERGCFALLDLLKNVYINPDESKFYQNWENTHNLLREYFNEGLPYKFIYNQLRKSKGKDKIILEFEKKIDKKKKLSNVLALMTISSFHYYAEAKGFPEIPQYLYATIPLITQLVITTIYKTDYDKLLSELDSNDDEEDQTNILGFEDKDEYFSIVKLEKQIEDIENDTQEFVNYLGLKGLEDILEVNMKIRKLLISSKSIDEINKELETLYDSLK